ncbi:hypothetical protein Tco_0715577 [Tanacetum coccineum]
MEAMNIRPELAPREIVGKTSTYLPPACYTMSKAEKTKFCQCLSEVKVPIWVIRNIKKVGVNARLEVVWMTMNLHWMTPPKTPKRGPSKLKDKPKEPFNVEFNDDGFAIGKHQNDWSTYVGGMARLRISILDDDWSQIEQDQKDALWEIIKKKRAIGKVYAKQQTNYARLGRSGYRGMNVDLSKVELDEALKEEILNITCDRTGDWILARITSPNISTDMEELIRKLVDVDKKMAQGLISKEKGADPLIVVLGPEHGKLAQRDAERDTKRDAQRDAERDAARDAVRDATKEAEIEVESENVETEASNEGRSQKRLKKNICSNVKEPKSCMLFSPYTEDKKPIARGMVYPIGDGGYKKQTPLLSGLRKYQHYRELTQQTEASSTAEER